MVRSFAALPLSDDGTVVVNETIPQPKIAVCDKTLNGTVDDEFGDYTCGDNNIAIELPLNPDYLVNSLVDVDGGTGSDRLTVVGTEFNDRYVVQDGKIFGGGLTVKVRTKTNIEFNNLIILS